MKDRGGPPDRHDARVQRAREIAIRESHAPAAPSLGFAAAGVAPTAAPTCDAWGVRAVPRLPTMARAGVILFKAEDSTAIVDNLKARWSSVLPRFLPACSALLFAPAGGLRGFFSAAHSSPQLFWGNVAALPGMFTRSLGKAHCGGALPREGSSADLSALEQHPLPAPPPAPPLPIPTVSPVE